ncbi:rRNA maturation RNase YbeY [bacterium (Candidatus Gribaldobacteria) CG_4_9_14_3_um_filter_36_15]|uniref:Endoribonuclease YbeY n=4 Tax=Candidatus Gribaldobacteria TaxID=2798536 RepID=A0A2M7VJQ3_9BACT|nr:MAG: rRNA maturation RNase YbeY [Parcubacteria group bacterium CG2_30_36_21]PIR91207.1 MAG: rRNA maturation RNase YbeY [bacterium (Candidatus Gribaldobacteria) CG10_big_fil_rev_8_21_14_0_10_37_46]PIV13976.1 MAG: rRNA maturation RNase YbeY [bacterium (Candidatus Gribaldobacteria) CG03_land_8_20_14_0_80_36_40]PJA02072.1 MAG: rRNA maturation RNase YbeY [bacterium (Candidatus Gribaldobacteria) CG_4_10_14_0_2_um_filter_36_18]PJB09385.1 MAG: rRNA maturation RNase YbeY [bacterium (Candidatus Gribal
MIEIRNLTGNLINEDFIKEISRKVLREEKKPAQSKALGRAGKENISLAFIGSGRMRELNKRYRGENRVTDVLIFGEDLKEIVICLREVKKNAKRYETTFEKELARVLIHGILHLLGYDHEKPSTRAKLGAGLVPHRNEVSGAGSNREAKKMREKEEYYLKLLNC